MIMIVPFVVVLLWGSPRWDYLALAIFIVASLTDAIDGHIARKHHLITNFGKFMDPLADKLLVSAAMVVLVALGRIPAWIVIVILSREFIISGFRQVAADQGIVIAASYWGKWKTVFQMVMICLMIADFSFSSLIRLLTDVVMWAALALTVISMIDYLIKNKGVMAEQK
jgi:CDP-diacylglycerol--glycerol-3-phosphate 3-phosphatidyltransferase